MQVDDVVQQLKTIYQRRGVEHYGEQVTQLSHAVSCAKLAHHDGQSDSLVIAAFLHDVGHLVDDLDGFQSRIHDRVGADYLQQLGFDEAVVEPIRQHAEAKRYLCHREQGYLDTLSEASLISLVFQGGIMTDAEADRFENLERFNECVTLRRYDDLGKAENYIFSEAEWVFEKIELYLNQ
ncbi:HD domain-containing protein [Neptunomonas concharum]|uniref:HDIG domain-containing protein n=1 Tax=Neptunomonas concharum TaxID=1031538 RepID=A0A5P1RCU0_9GAMM|nr:HDIG domain-containing metalloprotein [Neptunomonas concharum]QEQ97086.1 HDIG domain-containing protein [Neptunomonas concharum]